MQNPENTPLKLEVPKLETDGQTLALVAAELGRASARTSARIRP